MIPQIYIAKDNKFFVMLKDVSFAQVKVRFEAGYWLEMVVCGRTVSHHLGNNHSVAEEELDSLLEAVQKVDHGL